MAETQMLTQSFDILKMLGIQKDYLFILDARERILTISRPTKH